MAKGSDLVTPCQTHTELPKSCPVEGRHVETGKRLYFISRCEDIQELVPPFPFSLLFHGWPLVLFMSSTVKIKQKMKRGSGMLTL